MLIVDADLDEQSQLNQLYAPTHSESLRLFISELQLRRSYLLILLQPKN